MCLSTGVPLQRMPAHAVTVPARLPHLPRRLAPIPPNKLRKLVADVEAGLEALAEGK